MALTISHVIVAPILYPLLGKRVPMATLAIGAMSPDIAGEIFSARDFAHQYTGLMTIDLFIGLFGCLLWYVLYRPCVYAGFARVIPNNINSRLDMLFYSVIGVLIGALTHLFWDYFTHADQAFFILPAIMGHDILNQPIHIAFLTDPVPRHLFLQYMSSIIALPFLYFLLRPVLTAEKDTQDSSIFPQYLSTKHILRKIDNPLIFKLIIVVSLMIGGYFIFMHQDQLKYLLQQDRSYFFYREIFIEFSTGFALVFTLLCLLFRLKIARVFNSGL